MLQITNLPLIRKRIYKVLVIILAVLLVSFKTHVNTSSGQLPFQKIDTGDTLRLNREIDKVKQFIKTSGQYNASIAFLLDMKIPSGKNRFFIVDLQRHKIVDQGLVAHGSGSETGRSGILKFSNQPRSFATSLGIYVIGNAYLGNFGKAYNLHGLEDSNSNAFKRRIVLHTYGGMPYNEQISPICLSLGCPMVNIEFYQRLQLIIDSTKTPIILYIYY
ncbi:MULTISPECIES: murein L,D-transpeptidase catalytic domain-containing protein [unclassified Sphingobacterium]|uniref:murein L,D-transpeptidase catalytic domain-containing protein n=1 Tax=unclassified Sphingobacterium TaxID=2609468 RepID=UPI00104F605C|nr:MULTISPECIES: murein L,D-transpeptidase catalytic domain family protein [unclassified Sphingobacterium]MCS3556182.1 hypothetical protein [Sphingobacterium sp. JUb21]TCR08558.1 L,D-transpeptidase-like protein [Sphingobacterium sp. JUb20]